MVKNLSAKAGGKRDEDSIPGSGRFPAGGHSNSLQYSCLGNSMNREAWWAIVHVIAKSWIQLSSYIQGPREWSITELAFTVDSR